MKLRIDWNEIFFKNEKLRTIKKGATIILGYILDTWYTNMQVYVPYTIAWEYSYVTFYFILLKSLTSKCRQFNESH